MRYVFYAAAALVAVTLWFNTSTQGSRIKRQLTEHPADPQQLYGR